MDNPQTFNSVDLVLTQLKEARDRALEHLRTVQSREDLERFRVDALGKKSVVMTILKSLKEYAPELRKEIGRQSNLVRETLEKALAEKQELLTGQLGAEQNFIDYTLPGRTTTLGRRHPITQAIDEISCIFQELGFQVADGREIETERYNFTILNIPLEHPARDAFDTFYTEQGVLLRSQTSTVQGRIMEKHSPPLAVLAAGKVYRPDTVDACHSFMFHQMEGFWVDKNVRFSDLKGVLHHFARRYFGTKTEIRFRPHFFPFTEPSVEVDISCFRCRGKGCSVCSRSGWIEILGAGMIHPNVFQHVGYDTKKYTGFAFGLGIERICMLRQNVNDIRYFYENKQRFLEQF